MSTRSPLLTSEVEELLALAANARRRAYAPYSRFGVGAAVRSETGALFPGFNVENSSFGATMCAERMALFCALAAGERALTHLALVADQPEPLSPCGICRQVIAELAPNATIVMANLDGQVRLASIGELLPVAFCLPTVRPDDGARG